jgi:uncharacterized membrane protein YfcA
VDIYLPIAGLSLNCFFLVGLGGLVGLLSGLFGVGGGFLLTPLLIFAGIPPTVAAASDSNQIVAAASSGAYAYSRMGHVDFKMGFTLVLGGIAGGSIGVHLIKILSATGSIDFLIQSVYVIILGVVGVFMFFESLRALRRRAGRPREADSEGGKESALRRLAGRLPWQMHFEKSRVRTSVLFPLFLGTAIGILAAIMGVGGDFILVPAMIYILGLPTIVAVGTSLFQITLTCINLTLQQAMRNQNVDLILVILLFIGSTVGAQIGARLGKALRGEQTRILMAVIVLLVTAKMLMALLMAPENIISLVTGGGGH